MHRPIGVLGLIRYRIDSRWARRRAFGGENPGLSFIVELHFKKRENNVYIFRCIGINACDPYAASLTADTCAALDKNLSKKQRP